MTSFHHQSTPSLKALLLCILLTAVAFLPVSLCAADKAPVIKKTVKIADFSKISAGTAIQVNYTQGPATGTATVSVSKDLEKYLHVEVKNGKLTLYLDRKSTQKSRSIGPNEMIVTVQSPTLTNVELGSAASLSAKDINITGSDFGVELSSAASATFNTIICRNLEASVSTAASLKATTLSGNIDIDCSSAASVSIGSIYGNKAELEGTSAASITVGKFAGRNLFTEVASGAKITVKNISCNMVQATAASGGDINISGKWYNLNKNLNGGTISDGGATSGGKSKSVSVTTGTDGSDVNASKESLRQQRKALEAQRRELETQRRELDKQRRQLEEKRHQLEEQQNRLDMEESRQRSTSQTRTVKATSSKKTKKATVSKSENKSDEKLRIP